MQAQRYTHLILFAGLLVGLCSPAAAREANMFKLTQEVKLLEQSFDNLDIFWGLGIQNSAEYAEIHNVVMVAAPSFPEATIIPISMPTEYSWQCVEFLPGQRRPELLAQCPALFGTPQELAQQSYQRTQQMFAAHYTATFHPVARSLQERLLETVQREPDSALGDFVGKLDAILAYIETVGEDAALIDTAHFMDTRDTLKDAEILLQLEEQIRQTLRNDLSFEPGKYAMADFGQKGQQAISAFIENLLAIKAQYPMQYPGQLLTIKIKTVGYTDQVPVSNPKLIEALTQGIDAAAIPTEEVERRKFLNHRLSEFRSRTVNEYAQARLQELTRGDSTLKVEVEIVGKGEEFPATDADAPKYLSRDPRRRICKISVIFRRQSPPSLFGKTTF